LLRFLPPCARRSRSATDDAAAFTDNLPPDVVVATPANVSSPYGGSVTATSGSGSITVSGDVTFATPCTISVDVTSKTLGAHTNAIQAGDVTTLDTGSNELAAQATLNVNGSSGLDVAKSFAPSAIPAGGTSRLTITLIDSSNIAFPQLSVLRSQPRRTSRRPAGGNEGC
jgi:hypothetical protein